MAPQMEAADVLGHEKVPGRPHWALWWQLLRLEAGGLLNRSRRFVRTLGAMAWAAYGWFVVGCNCPLTWPLVVLLRTGRCDMQSLARQRGACSGSPARR